MTDAQEQLARIGAAIAHAEALQKQAEAAHARIEAEGRALQKTAAQLLMGVEERAQALGAQEQRLARQIEKLGPFAFAGGQAAVKEEVRAALRDAASVAGAAAREATAPVQGALSAGVAAIGAAQESLAQAQRRFSWRALAILGASAFGALALAATGGFVMIGWQYGATI